MILKNQFYAYRGALWAILFEKNYEFITFLDFQQKFVVCVLKADSYVSLGSSRLNLFSEEK